MSETVSPASDVASEVDGGAAVNDARVPDAVGDHGDNVLLLGADHGDPETTVCAGLLSGDGIDRANVLIVTFADAADERLERLADHADIDASKITVIDVTRDFVPEEAADPVDGPRVEAVSDPGDLQRLGIVISSRLADLDGATQVCFHSITALLQYTELERAYRFLHTLGGRISHAGARAHYHADPKPLDEETAATLRPLFDTVLRPDEDGSWNVETMPGTTPSEPDTDTADAPEPDSEPLDSDRDPDTEGTDAPLPEPEADGSDSGPDADDESDSDVAILTDTAPLKSDSEDDGPDEDAPATDDGSTDDSSDEELTTDDDPFGIDPQPGDDAIEADPKTAAPRDTDDTTGGGGSDDERTDRLYDDTVTPASDGGTIETGAASGPVAGPAPGIGTDSADGSTGIDDVRPPECVVQIDPAVLYLGRRAASRRDAKSFDAFVGGAVDEFIQSVLSGQSVATGAEFVDRERRELDPAMVALIDQLAVDARADIGDGLGSGAPETVVVDGLADRLPLVRALTRNPDCGLESPDEVVQAAIVSVLDR